MYECMKSTSSELPDDLRSVNLLLCFRTKTILISQPFIIVGSSLSALCVAASAPELLMFGRFLVGVNAGKRTGRKHRVVGLSDLTTSVRLPEYILYVSLCLGGLIHCTVADTTMSIRW